MTLASDARPLLPSICVPSVRRRLLLYRGPDLQLVLPVLQQVCQSLPLISPIIHPHPLVNNNVVDVQRLFSALKGAPREDSGLRGELTHHPRPISHCCALCSLPLFFPVRLTFIHATPLQAPHEGAGIHPVLWVPLRRL